MSKIRQLDYVYVMFRQWRVLWGSAWRARLGAVVLHLFAGAVLFSLEVAPFPPDNFDVVSIELVDAVVETPAEIAPVIELPAEPEEPEALEPVISPKPEPEPVLEEETPEVPDPIASDAPPASAPSGPIAVAPQITVSEPEPEPEEEEEIAEAPEEEVREIDPRYIIRRDPFLEVAPSAASRVIASAMCARTNRETRPAYCPETSAEDERFALLARAQGDFRGYSPRDEALFARSTFNRFARGSRYAPFLDEDQGFEEFASTGASPVRRQGVNIPRHPEGLQNCTPVNTGIARVGGETSGLNHAVTNGSELFCD